MEHVCFIDPNMENFHDILNSNHQDQEPPFFSSFPSPFFDDTSTTAPSKNHTHQHKPPPCLPCESKRLIKKRTSVGKKDRHSKIHTAQGIRDRRMRLSLEIARKFFDLQDLLGFDKASNTIEWLFSKSNKAIKEVAQNSDHPQSMSHDETKSCIGKPEIKNDDKQLLIPNNNSSSSSVLISCCRETTSREQKRARARDRTRERMMMKQLEKSSKAQQLFVHPKDEIYKLGLAGCLASPNNHSVDEELAGGFISSTRSPSEPAIVLQDSSSSPSLEYYSSAHHPNFLPQLQYSSTIDNVNYSFENYSGSRSIVDTSTAAAAGWLNYSNGGLLGMPGEWNAATADRIISEYYNNNNNNYETSTLTGDIYNNYEQNPSSFFMSSTTNNILHF